MKALIYDTETGGLDAKKHSVFSVGALVGDLDTGEIIDMFEAYHRLPSVDDYVYSDRAIEIHGITPQEAFDKGISATEIQEKFTDLWMNNGASIIGGHNEPFDRRFTSELFGITVLQFEANFTHRSLDSLPIVRISSGHENVASGATLTQAIKFFNIDMGEFGKNKFHAALFDSICAFKLMHRFRSVVTQKDVVARLQGKK